MGREVRRVPATWQHPQENGHYVPLHEGFSAALAEWEEGLAHWLKGERQDWFNKGQWIPIEAKYDGNRTEAGWIDWHGSKPRAEEYMPDWHESLRTHLQMYETCSEGTPISPVMATPEDLARWLADNRASAFGDMTATYEQWLACVRAGSSVGSMVIANGKMESGVDACAERDRDA